MNTVYLIVKNYNGVIDSDIIPLINERGNTNTIIKEGDTWGDLKYAFESCAEEKGRGKEIIKYKDGVEYWVLPFEYHELMHQPVIPEDAFVLDINAIRNFNWDIIEL